MVALEVGESLKMKLLFGTIIWLVQLVYLLVVAVLKAVMQLFSNVSTTTQQHLKENEERGKTFVRAYYFLEALESGAVDSPETANRISSSLFESWSDPDVDNKVIRRAAAYAKQYHAGNQLPIIKEARDKGFVG